MSVDPNGEPRRAMDDLSAEMELLRMAVRHGLGATAVSDVLASVISQVDWTRVFWLGRQHGVLLFLHHALRTAAAGLVPPAITAQLEIYRETGQMRSLARGRELCQLHDVLGRRGLPVIAVDGWLLARKCHDRPELREFGGSISLLVDQRDRDAVVTVLSGIGYDFSVDTLKLASRSRSFIVLEEGEREHAGERNAATGGARNGGEPLAFAGRVLPTLSWDRWLRRICSRGETAGWKRLAHAADVVALARRGDAEGWNRALAGARRDGSADLIRAGVGEACRMLELERPVPCGRALVQHAGAAEHSNACPQRASAGGTPAVSLSAAGHPSPEANEEARSHDEPVCLGRYATTPPKTVAALLKLAEVGPADVVYDLGCGDGRVVIAAAAEFGACGVGIDFDPARIAEAHAAAELRRVTDRVEFECADMLATDLREATVVFVYLEGFAYSRLSRKLERELRPGTRVITHDFTFPGWLPEKAEIVRVDLLRASVIYVWRIGQAAAGAS